MQRRTLFNYMIDMLKPNKRIKVWAVIVLFFMLIFNTLLIYITGGIPSAFAHTMYLPVLIGAVYFGIKGAVITGVLSGLLVGPLMRLPWFGVDTEPIANSIYRLLYFVLLGIIISWLIKYLRKQFESIHVAHTHDSATKIPNFNYYTEQYGATRPKKNMVSITLLITNYEVLFSMLGNNSYRNILSTIHAFLKTTLSDQGIIMLIDSNRFWIELSIDDYLSHHPTLLTELDNHTFYSDNVPLYIDFIVGESFVKGSSDALRRFKESDIAATKAKADGLKHMVFSPIHEQENIMFRRLGHLPDAIRNDELFLVYQPIINMKEPDDIGLEGLIRWKYKDEVLNPIDFIPVAEQTEIINQITAWLTKSIIKDMKVFKEHHPSIYLTMNISQRNLHEQSLIDEMIKAFNEAGYNDGSIELEITESTYMLDRNVTQTFLTAFRENGVPAILDDFGTEYSSLAWLRDLTIGKIKIDQDFTINIPDNKDTRRIVQVIIELAHHMDLKVIAEGVENEAIMKHLQDMRCDYAQGYYYARPMTLNHALDWLAKYAAKEPQKMIE